MRKLASIQRIKYIRSIENADRIEVATILGWECVIKKGEFKAGDLCVYCEVDSVLPKREEFEFLRSRKFRIKTIKLRKQISQGIAFPLHIIPNGNQNTWREGEDVTDIIGIVKYEPKENLNKQLPKKYKNPFVRFMMQYEWFRNLLKKDTKFPTWVSKTDEPRLQTIPYALTKFANYYVEITEKLDGQSATFTTDPSKFKRNKLVVASRNVRVIDKNSLFHKNAIKYGLDRILKATPAYIFQGEQCGKSIQSNKYNLEESKVYIFNLINRMDKYHCSYYVLNNTCKRNKLNVVPLLYTGKLKDFGSTVQDFVDLSKGKSKINPKIKREGIVVRCIENGKKLLSFKVINPEFLLQYEKDED